MKIASVMAKRETLLTPLRYPGGKGRLAGFLEGAIRAAGWEGCVYSEPFAGGAAAALALLEHGVAREIHINDLDPAIFAFWWAATTETDAFIRRIESTPVDLASWKEQRRIYQGKDLEEPFELGFATFFLNRTNRSGVMNAGVIGGQSQAGRFRIDARYNKRTLIQRIVKVGELSDKIHATCEEGADFIERQAADADHFLYVDPPYYQKGASLYMNGLDHADHQRLADVLAKNAGGRWVLTYDDAPEIRHMYKGRYQGTFELPYSAHRAERATELMVFSDAVVRQGRVFSRRDLPSQ